MSGRVLTSIGAAVLVVGLLTALAVVTVRSEQASRRELEERFALRTRLGAGFATSYVRSIERVEREAAREHLAGRRVSTRAFRRAVDELDFQAAVLLDAKGRLLHVWPHNPDLVGTELGMRYEHLRGALGGRFTVSDVVASAARGEPIVAFALPFATAEGRRVFSGGFAVGETPLHAYLRTALPFEGAKLALLDGTRLAFLDEQASSPAVPLARKDAVLARAVAERPQGTYESHGEARFFASVPVAGTKWKLVMTVPRSQLLAPLGGANAWIPWILLGVFAAAALCAAFLFVRLSARRAELAAANAQLARSNAELRELDRMKDEFVALVSHELRTPLTSIRGYVSALLRGRGGVVPVRQRELLEVVGRNAHRLQRLVEDLLLAAKSDAGKLHLELETVELATVVQEAIESARPHAEERDVTVEQVVDAPLELVADRARLVQVLDNLLSNAIKFTPPGGRVQVSLSARAPWVELAVEDTGIGIPEAEQDRLFERFFRASTATSREIAGTGLGLSIVKIVVDLHGGEIDWRSEEGVGTRFALKLPLARAEEEAA